MDKEFADHSEIPPGYSLSGWDRWCVPGVILHQEQFRSAIYDEAKHFFHISQ